MRQQEPTKAVKRELTELLRSNEGQIGLAFVLWEKGERKNQVFVDKGIAANSGAAGNVRASIEAIMLGVIPNGPTVAVIARSAVNGLLRRNPDVSKPTRTYLDALIQKLAERADDRELQETEERDLSVGSEEIQRKMGKRNGVYVFTYPAYMRFVKMTDPDRWLYKIGKSDGQVLQRIRGQATGMPEPALLLRVYVHPKLRPQALEMSFHKALIAAGHESVRTLDKENKKRHGAREWFATRLEFLDHVAGLLGCEIISAKTFGSKE